MKGAFHPTEQTFVKPVETAPTSIALVSVLALLAGIYAAWPIWRALFPMEIDLDEPWNAFHAEAARSGGTLYPDAEALTANNYPPLSFHFIGLITAVTGFDPIYIGRFLSLVSVFIIALCIATSVRLFDGTRLASTAAALWFTATMFRFFDGYVGKNDPHLPALAIMALALVWALRRHARHRPVEPAILLMVVAGFYKHSLIATPIATLLWIGSNSWQLGLRAGFIGAAAAVAGFALSVFLYRESFLHQLMMPRDYSIWMSLANLGQLQWIAPALAIWGVWAWIDRESGAARFSALYVGAGLFAYCVQKLGAGIGVNAQFELVTATAIGLGLALSRISALPIAPRWRTDQVLVVCLLILVARLLASSRVESYLVLASSDYRQRFAHHAEVVTREIDRVRSVPGPVHCSAMTVCLRAGKGFVLDRFAIDQKLRKGLITDDAFGMKLQAANIRMIEIDPRAGTDSLQRRLR